MSQQSSCPGIHLVCTNAQGLTPGKLLDHLSWCKERRVDISVLTETKTASSPEALLRQLPGAGAIWPGATFFSCPGTGHSEGIVIIVGPRCPLSSSKLRPPRASRVAFSDWMPTCMAPLFLSSLFMLLPRLQNAELSTATPLDLPSLQMDARSPSQGTSTAFWTQKMQYTPLAS